MKRRQAHGKRCFRCGELKPLTEFGTDNSKKIDGKKSSCKSCLHESIVASRRRYEEKHPGRNRPERLDAQLERVLREKDRPKRIARRKRAREKLEDEYVIKLLTQRTSLRPSQVPAELVEVKRAHLRIKRELGEIECATSEN